MNNVDSVHMYIVELPHHPVGKCAYDKYLLHLQNSYANTMCDTEITMPYCLLVQMYTHGLKDYGHRDVYIYYVQGRTFAAIVNT